MDTIYVDVKSVQLEQAASPKPYMDREGKYNICLTKLLENSINKERSVSFQKVIIAEEQCSTNQRSSSVW